MQDTGPSGARFDIPVLSSAIRVHFDSLFFYLKLNKQKLENCSFFIFFICKKINTFYFGSTFDFFGSLMNTDDTQLYSCISQLDQTKLLNYLS